MRGQCSNDYDKQQTSTLPLPPRRLDAEQDMSASIYSTTAHIFYTCSTTDSFFSASTTDKRPPSFASTMRRSYREDRRGGSLTRAKFPCEKTSPETVPATPPSPSPHSSRVPIHQPFAQRRRGKTIHNMGGISTDLETSFGRQHRRVTAFGLEYETSLERCGACGRKQTKKRLRAP